MKKIEIKSWLTGNVIFSYECEDNTIKKTVEKAVKEGANLYRANLYRALNLDKANKLPMFFKWSFGFKGDLIQIGCESRTIKEWDKFFKSDEELETKRYSEDFKRIEAVYKGLKAYYKHLNK